MTENSEFQTINIRTVLPTGMGNHYTVCNPDPNKFSPQYSAVLPTYTLDVFVLVLVSLFLLLLVTCYFLH